MDASDFRPGVAHWTAIHALGVVLELADDISLDLEAVDLAKRAAEVARRKVDGDADPDLCPAGP